MSTSSFLFRLLLLSHYILIAVVFLSAVWRLEDEVPFQLEDFVEAQHLNIMQIKAEGEQGHIQVQGLVNSLGCSNSRERIHKLGIVEAFSTLKWKLHAVQ